MTTCVTCAAPTGAGCDMTVHRTEVRLWDSATCRAIRVGHEQLALLCLEQLLDALRRWHALVGAALDGVAPGEPRWQPLQIDWHQALQEDGDWIAARLVDETGVPIRGARAVAYVDRCIAAGADRDFYAVIVEDAGDGKTADICHTGNGPNSKANAEAIAAAHNRRATA